MALIVLQQQVMMETILQTLLETLMLQEKILTLNRAIMPKVVLE